MNKTRYEISGLTCGGCVSRTKSALLPWADSVEVTLNPPQVTLTNPKADIDALNQALAHAGHYVLSPLSAEPKAASVQNLMMRPIHRLAQFFAHWFK